MAVYKYTEYIVKGSSDEFDKLHPPGGNTPYSGIYRCMGCHREIVSEENNPLPPQNHHQHAPGQGAIRWKLAVYADHKPK